MTTEESFQILALRYQELLEKMGDEVTQFELDYSGVFPEGVNASPLSFRCEFLEKLGDFELAELHRFAMEVFNSKKQNQFPALAVAMSTIRELERRGSWALLEL